jgi:hypothetical protein
MKNIEDKMRDLIIFKQGVPIGEIIYDPAGPVRLVLTTEITKAIRDQVNSTFFSSKSILDELELNRQFGMIGCNLRPAIGLVDGFEFNEGVERIRREAEFIYESNLIEDVTEISFDSIIASMVENRAKGHVSAWLMARALAEQKVALSSSHALYFQRLITEEQSAFGQHYLEPKYRGVLRDCPVYIAGKKKDIVDQSQFEEFFLNLEKDMKEIPFGDIDTVIKLAARTHLFFEEELHPFADGNGRTGRIIVNYIFAYFGLPPMIFTNFDKEKYYSAFDVTDTSDFGKMMNYLKEKYF